MKDMQTRQYQTRGGVTVYRASMGVDGEQARQELLRALDTTPGVLLSSACEYPGRYTRWDIGFCAPPLQLTARAREVEFKALNERGQVLLQLLGQHFVTGEDYCALQRSADRLAFSIQAPEPVLYEEERTRQRSIFTVLRQVMALFASDEDQQLGLYGAFGYGLAFQFEAIQQRLPRLAAQRDLVLYLPDRILVLDRQREVAQQHVYDFSFLCAGQQFSTAGLRRTVARQPFVPAAAPAAVCSDHAPGAYAAVVHKALEQFRCGKLFEVVPGQSFSKACVNVPSRLFERLQQQNPAPYGALLNLGEQEYLVAASPEMFVRVEGRQVDTCPISGTIARGVDALEDAEQIRTLLNSAKDEAELSMCTDVDRNDKSRVCEPGSVHLVGRRQIELYSRLIHTVDHVRGRLKPGFDALDAFQSHAWAVTVTGAPKHAAMQFIEDHEQDARSWYGGALGCLNFNGDLNTGLCIRSIHIRAGMAQVRVGATLLSDSDPEQEEAETRLKASALLAVLENSAAETGTPSLVDQARVGKDLKILMLDHQDSFVHTLSSMLQESGAAVRTIRAARLASCVAQERPDLVVLSPGPGRPAEHAMHSSIELCMAAGIPLFGVCLGLQGIVEYFGGTLETLQQPMHGKQSYLRDMQHSLFSGMPEPTRVGRYHSLVAAEVPGCLQVTARSEDGEVMALSHRSLPVCAVQFHPESILSAGGKAGRILLDNLVAWVNAERRRPQQRRA
ncbi:MAG TPA: anthranilate synthase component I [Pseudomonadaceae bacterium]|nr:anthranilate synthase component I [Pseudomonadaceae bacterium]